MENKIKTQNKKLFLIGMLFLILIVGGVYAGYTLTYSETNKLSFNDSYGTALQKLVKLNISTFYQKEDSRLLKSGLIIDEVEKIAPELVYTDADGNKEMVYGNIQWLTIDAIKELADRVIRLEQENTKLNDCFTNSKDFEEMKICVGK
jgi:hypothetical protein